MTDFLADTTDLLRRTPTLLTTLLGSIPSTWTETPDIADGWRPRDVVGHLISAEIVAGSYDAEVGPWKDYLGILLRRDDLSAVPG